MCIPTITYTHRGKYIHTEVRTMRKTIYCKDQSIWDSVKRKAGDQGLSISQFLLGLNMRDERPPPGQLDRIESKLDAHIAKNDSGNSSQLTQGRFGGGGRKIKKEKIETVKNMMGRSGAIPKGGKK